MAITFDAVSNGTPVVANTVISWSHVVASDANCLYVSIGAAGGAATGVSVTADGVSMTSIGSQSNLGVMSINCFVLKAPHTGTITITSTGSSADYVGQATSWKGVDQTTPNRTAVIANDGGSGTTSPTAVVVSNAVSGDMVIDTTTVDTTAQTVGTTIPQVERYKINNPSGDGYSFGSSSFPATGSTTMNWTFSGTQLWTSIGVALIPGATSIQAIAALEVHIL